MTYYLIMALISLIAILIILVPYIYIVRKMWSGFKDKPDIKNNPLASGRLYGLSKVFPIFGIIAFTFIVVMFIYTLISGFFTNFQ